MAPHDHVRQAAAGSTSESRRLEATYRLQFHAGFTFADATRIVPYLHTLGITHIYASPFLKARPGSTHGYDIIDHRVLNPEIGTPDDFNAFSATLRKHGLGLILDIVPNHMGVATNDNPWWNTVLENGPAARFADYFDIAWKATSRPELQDKVLLPVLGDLYGNVLESGRIRLKFEGGAFAIACYERILPVAPRTYSFVLAHRMEKLEAELGPDSPELDEYLSILTAIGHLPDRTDTERDRVVERNREKEVIKRRLEDLSGRSEPVRAFIARRLDEFNGTPHDPRSFDALDELLAHQCYRLAFWRVALEEINYRRFFDVNDLAAISVEREEVFAAVHELIFRLIAEEKVDGLRIDHPDGLYDPRQYLERLQRQALQVRGAAESDAAADPVRDASGRWPLYVVVEKILGAGEPLRADWPVAGTTGYEFLNAVNGLFVDGATERAFTHLYRELHEDYDPYAEVVYRSKRLILVGSLAGELNMLTHQLDRLAQQRRRSRDFTLNGLRAALREVIACFPVYRSYIADGNASEADRASVELAVRRAAMRNPLYSPAVFRFVRDMILLNYPDGATDEQIAEQRRFAGKFQQVTSPVMAKGMEDTAFYTFNRFVSLNEVGGNPAQFGTRPEALHRFFADRQANWPHSLSPLTTHDTKRSEDNRARIDALSEMPDAWSAAVRRWRELNAAQRVDVGQVLAPDANEEYLLYQTLVGAWPHGADDPGAEFADRIADYMTKAVHEAKVHSSWVNPYSAYDAAVQTFVRRILDPQSGRAFLDDFAPFQRRAARIGAINALAQTLLKIAAPGVADTYQGTELPDFSLVDPDNRRPVDYAARQALLDEVRAAATPDPAPHTVAAWVNDIEGGRAKLYLTWRALSTRGAHPGLFAEGEYLPLAIRGAKAEHVFAFARRWNGTAAVTAVPRLTARLQPDPSAIPFGTEIWMDTHLVLPEGERIGTWRDAFTGRESTPTDGTLAISNLFADFPAALLVRVS